MAQPEVEPCPTPESAQQLPQTGSSAAEQTAAACTQVQDFKKSVGNVVRRAIGIHLQPRHVGVETLPTPAREGQQHSSEEAAVVDEGVAAF